MPFSLLEKSTISDPPRQRLKTNRQWLSWASAFNDYVANAPLALRLSHDPPRGG